MEFVYVVLGETSDYSICSTWVVAVYLNEEQARLHAESAAKFIADILPGFYKEGETTWDFGRFPELCTRLREALEVNPYDPCCTDWNTEYHVYRTLLVRHVDEFQDADTETKPEKCLHKYPKYA